MKLITTILLSMGMGAAVMAASVSPAPGTVMPEKKEPVQQHVAVVEQTVHGNSAIKVIAPQKDLEHAIRSSEQGDILLQGQDGWYRIEAKALKQGTKMYVLGGQSSLVTSFPKEADNSLR